MSALTRGFHFAVAKVHHITILKTAKAQRQGISAGRVIFVNRPKRSKFHGKREKLI